MIALGMLGSAPMFVGKLVRAKLHGETVVVDARRDLSLLAVTTRSWGDDQDREMPVVVLRGRSTTVSHEDGGGFIPIALGRNGRFRVRVFHRGLVTNGLVERMARLRGRKLQETSERVAGHPTPSLAGRLTPQSFGSWGRGRRWRLGEISVATRSKSRSFPDGNGPTGGDIVWGSMVRRGTGTTVPLESAVEGGPFWFGKILYVSLEGWLVVQESRGLVWLYPIRRQGSRR